MSSHLSYHKTAISVDFLCLPIAISLIRELVVVIVVIVVVVVLYLRSGTFGSLPLHT